MSELDDLLNAAEKTPANTPLSDLVDDIAERTPPASSKTSARKAEKIEERIEKSSAQPSKTKERDNASDKTAKKPGVDKYITAIYLTLCVISIIELYSASSREVSAGNVFGPLVRHLLQLIIGAAICFGVSKISYRWLVPFTPVIAFVSAIAMVGVLIGGEVINGARRGFTIAGILVLPAELLKLSAVLVIARVTARNQQKGGGVKNRGVIICAAVVIFFSGLLFSQGLTNTLLLMSISLSMMLVGGIQWKKLGVVCLVYAFVAGGALYVKMHSDDSPEGESTEEVSDGHREKTWANRLTRWGNDSVPKYQQPITAENRQEMYSYMAQANGGVIGVMPGNSRETARLPLAFSDYIYSIIVEDIGFIGGIVLIIIYLSLMGRASVIASRCEKIFPALLVLGMAVMICLQALFHMAIVTGFFPVSGQPLPMISKGGMSIFVTSFAFGIMLSVSRYAASGKKERGARTKVKLPKSINADNPMQVK